MIASDYLDSVFAVERSCLERYIRPGDRVLNIGAGTGGGMNFVKHEAGSVVHFDMDYESLKQIRQDKINSIMCGTIYELPFENGSFDVAVCDWVIEHLENPAEAMREVVRVLKKGGRILILTPNLISVFSLVSLLTSYRLKRLMRKSAFSADFEKPHPVYYRFNRVHKINTVFAGLGCRLLFLKRIGAMYIYFKPGGLFYRMSVLYERLTEARLLNWSKMYLYLVYEKG